MLLRLKKAFLNILAYLSDEQYIPCFLYSFNISNTAPRWAVIEIYSGSEMKSQKSQTKCIVPFDKATEVSN